MGTAPNLHSPPSKRIYSRPAIQISSQPATPKTDSVSTAMTSNITRESPAHSHGTSQSNGPSPHAYNRSPHMSHSSSQSNPQNNRTNRRVSRAHIQAFNDALNAAAAAVLEAEDIAISDSDHDFDVIAVPNHAPKTRRASRAGPRGSLSIHPKEKLIKEEDNEDNRSIDTSIASSQTIDNNNVIQLSHSLTAIDGIEPRKSVQAIIAESKRQSIPKIHVAVSSKSSSNSPTSELKQETDDKAMTLTKKRSSQKKMTTTDERKEDAFIDQDNASDKLKPFVRDRKIDDSNRTKQVERMNSQSDEINEKPKWKSKSIEKTGKREKKGLSVEKEVKVKDSPKIDDEIEPLNDQVESIPINEAIEEKESRGKQEQRVTPSSPRVHRVSSRQSKKLRPYTKVSNDQGSEGVSLLNNLSPLDAQSMSMKLSKKMSGMISPKAATVRTESAINESKAVSHKPIASKEQEPDEFEQDDEEEFVEKTPSLRQQAKPAKQRSKVSKSVPKKTDKIKATDNIVDATEDETNRYDKQPSNEPISTSLDIQIENDEDDVHSDDDEQTAEASGSPVIRFEDILPSPSILKIERFIKSDESPVHIRSTDEDESIDQNDEDEDAEGPVSMDQSNDEEVDIKDQDVDNFSYQDDSVAMKQETNHSQKVVTKVKKPIIKNEPVKGEDIAEKVIQTKAKPSKKTIVQETNETVESKPKARKQTKTKEQSEKPMIPSQTKAKSKSKLTNAVDMSTIDSEANSSEIIETEEQDEVSQSNDLGENESQSPKTIASSKQPSIASMTSSQDPEVASSLNSSPISIVSSQQSSGVHSQSIHEDDRVIWKYSVDDRPINEASIDPNDEESNDLASINSSNSSESSDTLTVSKASSTISKAQDKGHINIVRMYPVRETINKQSDKTHTMHTLPQEYDSEPLPQSSHVTLNPPRENASIEELLLRDKLLQTLGPVLGTKLTYQVMNSVNDIVQNYGDMLSESLQALWSLMLMNKRSLDYCVKTKIVFEGIISAKAVQAGTSNMTKEEVNKICSEIVPLVGKLFITMFILLMTLYRPSFSSLLRRGHEANRGE